MPLERELLDWKRPFSDVLGDWLWERRDCLSGMLMIVPTAQSGRRVRQDLAERGGALAPRVRTPGFFIRDETCAPNYVEVLAWVEVLERISDWDAFGDAFPHSPEPDGEGPGWAIGLARTFTEVREILLTSALTMRSAAKWMKNTAEADRWNDLGLLEEQVERTMKDWGWKSRSTLAMRPDFTWTEGLREVILAGVTDVSRIVIKILEQCPLPVRILLAGEQEEDFDEWGRPVAQWKEREIRWPEKNCATLAVDARQQAEKALEKIAVGEKSRKEQAKTNSSATGRMTSSRVALGSADEAVTRELIRTFKQAGWELYDPGNRRVMPLNSWLTSWRSYLLRPGVSEVMDLLSFPESDDLVSNRAYKADSLSRLQDRHLVRSTEDIGRVATLLEKQLADESEEQKSEHLEKALKSVEQIFKTMTDLEQQRKRFLSDGFHRGMRSLLPRVYPDDAVGIMEWLDQTQDLARKVERPPAFWLELLQFSIQPTSDPAPEERVLDVQGWVELFFEPGEHLVICGMNEGKIPAHRSTNAWLPEATRRELQLPNQESLASRDAYLLSAMLKARESNGHVDLILGKTSGTGDVLLPSRLLLAAGGSELARRVELLFKKNLDPVEVGFAGDDRNKWQELKWSVDLPDEIDDRISVTAFRDYLSCPFRYYLTRVKGMRKPDPQRVEWSAADFGSRMHEILEEFGGDEQAREYGDMTEIENWLHDALDRMIEARFGRRPVTAIRIQRESMRERLSWFAEEQAGLRKDGWCIEQVEKDFRIEIEGLTVSGVIDRIDRNEQNGMIRVLDYKTSSRATKVAYAHGKKIMSNTALPAHLEGVDEVIAELPVGIREKVVTAAWVDLQVPLYAYALGKDSLTVDEAGYFSLGAKKRDVKVSLWPDFSVDDQQAALRCAGWVAHQIRAKQFWPPSQSPKYDAFEQLKAGEVLDLIEFK